MPLYYVEWKLATEVAVFSGKFVAAADDDAHAIERCKSALGKEGALAAFSVSRAGDVVAEVARHERIVGWEPSAPVPGESAGGQVFAFEIGARANVIASTEKTAMAKFAAAIRNGSADGRGCTLLKVAVLDREAITRMSQTERNALSTSFRKVSGGGVNPR